MDNETSGCLTGPEGTEEQANKNHPLSFLDSV